MDHRPGPAEEDGPPCGVVSFRTRGGGGSGPHGAEGCVGHRIAPDRRVDEDRSARRHQPEQGVVVDPLDPPVAGEGHGPALARRGCPGRGAGRRGRGSAPFGPRLAGGVDRGGGDLVQELADVHGVGAVVDEGDDGEHGQHAEDHGHRQRDGGHNGIAAVVERSPDGAQHDEAVREGAQHDPHDALAERVADQVVHDPGRVLAGRQLDHEERHGERDAGDRHGGSGDRRQDGPGVFDGGLPDHRQLRPAAPRLIELQRELPGEHRSDDEHGGDEEEAPSGALSQRLEAEGHPGMPDRRRSREEADIGGWERTIRPARTLRRRRRPGRPLRRAAARW